MSLLVRASRFIGSNLRAVSSKNYSQLLIASDAAGWVLDEEAREMIRIAGILGFPAYFAHHPIRKLRQCVHYTSLFSLARPEVFASNHRISVDYFHGKPDQDPAFRAVFNSMKANANRLHRVRISYSSMRPLALEAGIPADKIHQIPIGINPEYFQVQDLDSKKAIRSKLRIPQSAIVIGSFQKDGQGWGDGMEPKKVKGPDVFLKTLAILQPKVPELYVLLTGPARGYVKAGLEKLGIPYHHSLLGSYSEIGAYFQALDCYLVASREEGGPKAVLESMLSGVPLVSTRVGQAIDLVVHEKNGLLAEVEDAEALAGNIIRVLGDSFLRTDMLAAGAVTGRSQTYDAQLPLWRDFFANYVEYSR